MKNSTKIDSADESQADEIVRRLQKSKQEIAQEESQLLSEQIAEILSEQIKTKLDEEILKELSEWKTTSTYSDK